ncbi:YcxB family protein [Oceanobacillus kimchii]|uniref:YcxB family protein n=1 Tax=Oceanobacillus kimchii TaxID=746691 RepID=UPI0009857868|nr:YcxB family protein [Oceanobacillus kimchii]
MIAKFDITDNDLIAQQKNAIKKTKFHNKIRIMQLVVFFVFVVFILFIYGFSKNDLLFGMVIYLIVAPFLWKSYERTILKQFKKDIFKHQKNKMGTFTLTLSEDGFEKESTNLTETIKWKDIQKLEDDDDLYFLYITDLRAITIKKEPDNMNHKEINEYQTYIENKINQI